MPDTPSQLPIAPFLVRHLNAKDTKTKTKTTSTPTKILSMPTKTSSTPTKAPSTPTKTSTMPTKTPRTQSQLKVDVLEIKNVKLSNTNLRCYVGGKFLSRIYPHFGKLFTGSKNVVVYRK